MINFIRLQSVDRIGYYTVRLMASNTRDIVICTDWDYPRLAETFGYYGLPHSRTDNGQKCEDQMSDGTIDCSCGYMVSQFISDAVEFLDSHIGDMAEDPGFFDE